MKKKVIMVMSLIAYKIIYEIIYATAVSPIFSYMLSPYEPNMCKMVLSYILLVVVAIALPSKKDSVSEYLLAVFTVFTVVPQLSFFWQTNASIRFMLYCVGAFLLLEVVSGFNFKIKRDYKIVLSKTIVGRINILLVQALVIAILVFLISIKYGLADSRALDLHAIYEVRANRSFGGIYGYFVNWIPYALVPCLLCTALYMKKWGYVVFGVFVQFYMYLLLGSKTALFSIGLIMLSYYFAKWKYNYIFMWCAFISFLCIMTLMIWSVMAELMPFGIFPTRLLSVPAFISFEHYDFFSVNPKLFMSENFIGKMLGIMSPYTQLSTYLVSGGKSNHCTGYLGDAYDNGGLMFMLIYSIVLAVIYRMIDSIYRDCNNRNKLPVFVGILTYSTIFLNDGTLTSLFATGGLVIIIFILKLQTDKDRVFLKNADRDQRR